MKIFNFLYYLSKKKIFLLFFFCFIGNLIQAHEKKNLNNFGSHREAKIFMENIAKKFNFSQKILHNILIDIKYDKKAKTIISSTKNPVEKTLNWGNYQKQFISSNRVYQGVDFWKKHHKLLNKYSKKYRVPIAIIVSTIGIESFYGKHNGNYKVINSLIILSFVPNRRNKYFRKELVEFFRFLKNNQWNLKNSTDILGSYNGAIGPAQFMPSSINYYGVDGNYDGKKDLINDFEDIIASVGYYYNQAKWKPGYKIIKKLKTTPINVKTRSDIITVEGEKGIEYWKTFPNFKPILRYNNSSLYVMIIYKLSRRITHLMNK